MSKHIVPFSALLDGQFGAHPRRSVPLGLEDSLFADGADVYAILDAGRIPMFDAEALAQDAPYECLLGGDAVDKLGPWAPWIFRLDAESRLTRRLFTASPDRQGLWPLRSAVFLRSTVGLQDLRNHFRRFTQIADEAGKRYFLRFYCPDALPCILEQLAQDLPRLERWYRHRDKEVVESYWIPAPDRAQMAVFRQSFLSQQPSGVPFRLDAPYRRIMADIRHIQQRRKIAEAVLLSAGNADDLSAADWYRIVHESIDAAWAVGVGPEQALAYVAVAGLARGRGIPADEIGAVMQLPASPGEQTQRARRFAEAAQHPRSTRHDWATS